MKISKKSLTLTAQQLKFGLGVFIAAVIAFGLWWFVAHNPYERTAEQSMADLVNAVEDVCEGPGGVRREVTVNLPQVAGIKDWFVQTFRLPFATNVGNEPYFYIYYERFPPIEDGYCTGSATIDQRVTNLICYWSEDIPWSSNLMTTMFFDAIFGISHSSKIMDKIEGTLKKALIKGTTFVITTGIQAEIVSQITGLSYEEALMYTVVFKAAWEVAGPRIMNKIREIQIKSALEKAGLTTEEIAELMEKKLCEETLAAFEDAGFITWDPSKGKYIVNDEEWFNAIKKYAEWSGQEEKLGMFEIEKDPTGKIKEIFVDKKAYTAIFLEKIKNALRKLNTIFYDDFETKASANEILDRLQLLTDEEKIAICDASGLCQPSLFQKIKAKFHLTDLDEVKVKAFDESVDKLRKRIDNGLLIGKSKETLLTPFEKANQVMSDLNLKGDPLKDPSNAIPKFIEEIQNMGKIPYDDAYKVAVETYASKYVETAALYDFPTVSDALNNKNWVESMKRTIVTTFEVDEKEAEKIIKSIKWAEGRERGIHLWSKILAENEREAKLLRPLLEQKVFQMPENWEEFLKRLKYPLGYTLIRIQDLFTPFGATYIDRSLSYYSGTYCKEGELCLQMGYYVREYPLEKCMENGITEIKLKRDSWVGKNPGFYLVSPCFAKLEIWKDSNEGVVYIEPKLCSNKPSEYENISNYCFATADLVNSYVGSETASFVFNWLQVIPGLNYIGIAGELLLDFTREAIISYPYPYEQAGIGPMLLGGSRTTC